MDAVRQLVPTVGVESACEALGVARASFYRQPVFGPALPAPVILRPSPARGRDTVEAKCSLQVLIPLFLYSHRRLFL